MRPVCATFFATLLAILGAPAPVMAASAVTLVLQFDRAYSAELLTVMKREVGSIVSESGMKVDWRLRADVPSSEAFDRLVVVHFRGACTVDPGEAFSDQRRYYAFTYISDGAVLPFSEVECDKIGNSIRPLIPRRQWGERDALLGRALGRVLAHELFHMLTKTQRHGREGVTKSELSPAQLSPTNSEWRGLIWRSYDRQVLAKPGRLLQAEGFVVLTASFAAYHELNGSWLVFFLVFLWPDSFMVGYLANPRLGAALYNLVHTYTGPLLLGAASVFEHWHNALLFALIWTAHIGMDRMFGYGLKYPTFFKDTHLQRAAS